jgi:hypothetical protein
MNRLYAIVIAIGLGVSLTATGALVTASRGEDRDEDDEDEFKAKLHGFQEVPAISTTGRGTFKAVLSGDRLSLRYTLTYSGLIGEVHQAHIHLGQMGVNGGVSVFLCETTGSPDPFAEGAAGDAPTCPQEGTVTGTLTAVNIIGPNAQGIAPGEFGELVVALEAGVTYANVHSMRWPGGEIRGQISD